MTEPTSADPLAWHTIKAPSLEHSRCWPRRHFVVFPNKFRALCDGLVIRVEDFPTEEF
jgi:predicted Zn-dependent protease with MMP-like domain